MPCRQQWLLNILFQLAKHRILNLIKSLLSDNRISSEELNLHAQGPHSPVSSSVLCEGHTCLPGKQIYPLSRCADQVEADGSFLTRSSVLTACPLLLSARWLCETRRHLETRTHVTIFPDGCIRATRQHEKGSFMGFCPGAHALRKGLQGLPKTNALFQVLSVGKQAS